MGGTAILEQQETAPVILPETAAAEDAELSLARRLFNPHTLVSLAVAAAIIVFLLTGFDIDLGTTWTQIRASDPWLLAAAVVAFYLSFPLRGVRWLALMSNVNLGTDRGVSLPPLRQVVLIVLLGWFANCLVPARLGDAYRAYLVKRGAGVSFSRTVGTILAERVIDVVVLFSLLLAAAVGVVGGRNTGTAVGLLAVGLGFVLVLVAGLGVLYRFGGHFERLLPARLRPKFVSMQEGTFQSFQQVPWVVALTVAIWILEATRLYLAASALGITLELPHALFVALAGSLLTTVPVTPGGLGIVEAGLAGALVIAVPLLPLQTAVSIAILDRLISYWSLIGTGLLTFLAFGRRR